MGRTDSCAAYGAEAERQRALLQAVRGDAGLAGVDTQVGLRAYRAHARATALRALSAAYPSVQQLVGEACFATLATALWREQPPLRGDLAWFGEGLAGLLGATPALAEEAYLPDVARLEWAVHRAAFAADDDTAVAGLALLGEAEPEALWVRLRPGTAVLGCQHAAVAVWQAHQPGAGDDGLAAAREALAVGRRDWALVWRRGWRVEVGLMAAGEGEFTQRLCGGLSLGAALQATVAPDFSFEAWLLRALREGWLAAFEPVPATRSAEG